MSIAKKDLSFFQRIDKGFIARKRDAALSVALDPKMTLTHSLIFERLLIFASPFSFKLEISDGKNTKKIELPQGSLITSIDDLAKLMQCCKKTLFAKLRDLHNWDYILYGSFDRAGNIKYSRRYNQHQYIYIQIKNYEHHVEVFVDRVGKENFSLPDEVGKENFSLPDEVGKENFSLPDGLVEKKLLYQQENFSLPNQSKSNNNSNFEPPKQYNKTILLTNKQQQIVVVYQNLFKKKTQTNLPKEVCIALIKKFGEEKVMQNIKRLNFNKVENPVGFLITSLEENWDLPPSVEEKIEAEEKRREEERKRREEEWKNIQQKALPFDEAIKKLKSLLEKIGVKKWGWIVFLIFFPHTIYGEDFSSLPSQDELKRNLIQNNIEIRIKQQEIEVFKSKHSIFQNIRFGGTYNFVTQNWFYGVIASFPFDLFSLRNQEMKLKELELKQLIQEKEKELDDLYNTWCDYKDLLRIKKMEVQEREKEFKIKNVLLEYKKIEQQELIESSVRLQIALYELEKLTRDIQKIERQIKRMVGLK